MPHTGRFGIGVVAAAALALAPLAGCSASPGVTTIVLNINKPPALFAQTISEFEAQNPGIRVLVDPNDSNFIPSLVRDNPPDLRIAGWAAAETVLAQRGVFTDLSDTDAASRMPEASLDLVRQWGGGDGKLDALPFSLLGAGVIYNKDIFAEQDLCVPKTWDEFVTLCETLKSRGITPVYGTFREPWTTDMPIDYSVGDFSQTYAQLRTEGPTLTADSPASFQNTIKDQLDKAKFIFDQTQADANSRKYPDGNVAFANGEAAMYFQGPWALSELKNANPDVNVGTFPLPLTDDPSDTAARIVLDLVASIPSGAKHPQEARRFLDFLYQPEVNAKYNDDNAAFSPLEEVAPPDDPRIAGLVPNIQDQRFYLGMSAYFGAIPKSNYFQEFALNRDAEAMTSALTEEWQRQAWRDKMRGIN